MGFCVEPAVLLLHEVDPSSVHELRIVVWLIILGVFELLGIRSLIKRFEAKGRDGKLPGMKPNLADGHKTRI